MSDWAAYIEINYKNVHTWPSISLGNKAYPNTIPENVLSVSDPPRLTPSNFSILDETTCFRGG